MLGVQTSHLQFLHSQISVSQNQTLSKTVIHNHSINLINYSIMHTLGKRSRLFKEKNNSTNFGGCQPPPDPRPQASQ